MAHSPAGRPPRSLLPRRSLLRAAAAAPLAATLAAPAVHAQAKKTTLRFWTSQGAPVQMAAWKDIFGRFEQQNPQYTVAIELYSDDDVWPKLTAGYAARNLPDLVSYVQAYSVATLAADDLLEPFDDVVKAVGEDDFFPAMRDVYKYKGHYIAATLNNQTSSNLWYRKDLLEQAGIAAPPKTWTEQLAAAKAMTKGDIYGNSLPFGRTSMTSTMMVNFVHQAGGLIVNPDMSVGFNSPATVTALEFLREIIAYAPTGATGYSWGEVLNSFVTGRAAMAPYTGRPIAVVAAQNPKILDDISVVPYPYSATGRPAFDCAFNSLFIPRGAANVDGAKKLAIALFEPKNYVQFLHTAPGHNLPSLKSIAASPAFFDQPLMQKFRPQVEQMMASTAAARNLVQETDKSPYNLKAGNIFNSGVLAETVQAVVVDKVAPATAAARGADKIAEIMKG
ncbi:MAG: sugar ABC transporter substrate-binding protein [Proteobacteria bacterium]|nr:sugar ABC transporter substrate-binding protein [Pseudomonadota bacterium]